mmetsp:Transcript_15420/g.24658  ORF Transcript_15420/g.24658 Transcript_15420/m.24658 type:complete len:155 (+) Transcript_15420:1110-1574(+)
MVMNDVGHSFGVDWWAFGVFIFEMLAGWPPFYGETPFQVYQRIVDGVKKVQFPKYVDQKAAKLIKKLLKEDYRHRLGCLKNGGYDVRKEGWFSKLGFRKISLFEFEPPFKPDLGGEFDTKYFPVDEKDNEDDDDDMLEHDFMITKDDDEKFKDF